MQLTQAPSLSCPCRACRVHEQDFNTPRALAATPVAARLYSKCCSRWTVRGLSRVCHPPARVQECLESLINPLDMAQLLSLQALMLLADVVLLSLQRRQSRLQNS